MQLSQQEQQTLKELQELLSQELFTTDEIIDTNTRAFLNWFHLMAKDGMIDEKTADKICFIQSHVTKLIRCTDQLKSISI